VDCHYVRSAILILGMLILCLCQGVGDSSGGGRAYLKNTRKGQLIKGGAPPKEVEEKREDGGQEIFEGDLLPSNNTGEPLKANNRLHKGAYAGEPPEGPNPHPARRYQFYRGDNQQRKNVFH